MVAIIIAAFAATIALKIWEVKDLLKKNNNKDRSDIVNFALRV